MHFCHEELLALLSVFPFTGILVVRIRLWWHRRKHSCAHEHEVGESLNERA